MDRFDKIYYAWKNRAKYAKKSLELLRDPEQKKWLRKNRKFRNRYKGERCFIVGNGPSIRQQDLSLLANEYVFTVNYFPKSDQYPQVKSNFHVMMDPAIFDFDKDFGEEKRKQILKVNQEGISPVCFVQYVAKPAIEKYGLHEELKLQYVNCGISMYEHFSRRFDLEKVCPGFSNVVLYAAMIAIYMGFREIYFIGCDMTGYEQISVTMGKQVDLHAYKMDEKEKKMIEKAHEQMDAEAFFEGFFHMFMEYRLMNEFSAKHRVHLYNATKGGILNILERVDYESLFNEPQKL